MKLTKEQKLEVYLEALHFYNRWLSNAHGLGLCTVLCFGVGTGRPSVILRKELPEVFTFWRRLRYDLNPFHWNPYWFNFDDKGMHKRKMILRKAIKKLSK